MDVIKTQNQLLTYLPRELCNLIIEYMYNHINQETEDKKTFQYLVLEALKNPDFNEKDRALADFFDSSAFSDRAKLNLGKFLIDEGYGKLVDANFDRSSFSKEIKIELFKYYLSKLDTDDWKRECMDIFSIIYGRWRQNSIDPKILVTPVTFADLLELSLDDSWHFEVECYLKYTDLIVPELQRLQLAAK